MSGYRLPKHKHMSMNSLEMCNVPKKVYIPLISGNDTKMNPLVKIGEYVEKGQILARRRGTFETPIFSSVSGYVMEIKEMRHQSGAKVKCLVIDNDLRERKRYKKKEVKTKKEFVELLKECGIVGMGGAGFPTYFKYNTDEKVETLLINAVECEPYITADWQIIMEKCELILEAIDKILKINNIKEAVFAIKKTNTEAIEEIKKYIGTYPKIKLKEVRNIYPMGWERTLIKEALNLEYDRLPIEKGIIVNNVSTIYAIYEALNEGKPLFERIITVTGEGVKKPCNCLVKVGTKVSDILTLLGGKHANTIIIAGGPMMGSEALNNLVVTPELNCILVLPKKEQCLEKNCLRCGKCEMVCPAGLIPVLIKDNLGNKENLNKLNVNKCISCGLCSYICPSNIDVRDKVNQAKMEVK